MCPVEGGDSLGITPLGYTCIHGHLSCLQMLLRSGADTNVCDNTGQKPIDYAIRFGHSHVVRYLHVRQLEGVEVGEKENLLVGRLGVKSATSGSTSSTHVLPEIQAGLGTILPGKVLI